MFVQIGVDRRGSTALEPVGVLGAEFVLYRMLDVFMRHSVVLLQHLFRERRAWRVIVLGAVPARAAVPTPAAAARHRLLFLDVERLVPGVARGHRRVLALRLGAAAAAAPASTTASAASAAAASTAASASTSAAVVAVVEGEV